MLRFRDESWNGHEWALKGDMSELIQHEYDRLDGILATMRAVDSRALVYKGK
ncbi:MAG: hypothetical protein DBX66_03555 [Clostridiales bacterium]|nr:MAG: hypothetical protein DBX66_03555 [Clostridiales bacterium]RGB67321.1 hypothetical protein DW086_07305 [Harryflintia acetispora]